MRLQDAGEGDVRGQWPHPGKGRKLLPCRAQVPRSSGWPQALRTLTAGRRFPPRRVGMVNKDGRVLVSSQSTLSTRHLLRSCCPGCASRQRRLKRARGRRYQLCATHSTARRHRGRKHAQVTRGPGAAPAIGTPQSPGLPKPSPGCLCSSWGPWGAAGVFVLKGRELRISRCLDRPRTQDRAHEDQELL